MYYYVGGLTYTWANITHYISWNKKGDTGKKLLYALYVCIYKYCLHYSEYFYLTKLIDPLFVHFRLGAGEKKIIVLHHHEKVWTHFFFHNSHSALCALNSHAPQITPTPMLPAPSLPQSNVCLNVFMNCHFHGRAVLSFDDMQSNLLARPAAWLDFYQEFVTLQQLYIYTHTYIPTDTSVAKWICSAKRINSLARRERAKLKRANVHCFAGAARVLRLVRVVHFVSCGFGSLSARWSLRTVAAAAVVVQFCFQRWDDCTRALLSTFASVCCVCVCERVHVCVRTYVRVPDACVATNLKLSQ